MQPVYAKKEYNASGWGKPSETMGIIIGKFWEEEGYKQKT